MTNWANLHPNFNKSWGEDLKKQWENNNFNYQQVKTWISIGLIPREHDFAWWIINKQNLILTHLNEDKIEELREKLKDEWKDISSDWNIEVQVGVLEWIKKGFAFQEVEQWMKLGLSLKEIDLAIFSKQKVFDPQTVNIEKLRREYEERSFVNAQEYLENLEKEFSKEERTNIKKLDISWKKLKGSLKLERFHNLEELYCYGNKLTSLDCSNCPQLKILRCQGNNLTNLDLTSCSSLVEVWCNKNQLADLNFLNSLNSEKLEVLLIANNKFSASNLEPFSKFTNLKNLGLGNWFKEYNNNFFGSLEYLQKLTKLEDLDIAGTDIADGLKYLPDKIQIFYCFTKEIPECGVKVIAGELRKYGETERDDDGDENFAHPLRIWQEFQDSPAQQWLDENYPLKERADISYLDISKKNLKRTLKSEGFIKLGTLKCANNQLTNLNLSDCQNLFELDCSNNELYDLYFLKDIDKLECLTIKNNPKLAPQSLKYLANLKSLQELNLSNCPLKGSLKPLESLSKLEVLRVSNTDIEEGLEYLPINCKKLYCDFSYESKSIKIVKELDKSKCFEWDENGNGYYNLDKWREDKQNSAIASVIPLERFFVIRSNIKKFVNKWGIKEKAEEDDPHWYTPYLNYAKVPYDKLNRLWSKLEKNNPTELSKLQTPEQYKRNWYWIVPQMAGRGIVGISGILGVSGNLSLEGHQIGAIAIASPVVETITSYAKSNWYEDKEKQWTDFIQDAKEFLDNYHELLGILETIKNDGRGQLSKTLENLKKVTREFLNEYDNDQNLTIDVLELQKGKEKLANDLNDKEGKLKKMIKLMRLLEEKINIYDQGKPFEEMSLDNKKQELSWIIVDSLTEYSNSEFDAEKKYNEKGKNNWNEKNTWEDYLKKVEEKDFIYAQENLLYSLIEVMIERLENINLKETLTDQEENEKKLTVFIEETKGLCEICQRLKNKKLDDVIVPLKSKIDDFSDYLKEHSANNKKEKDQIAIEIAEEEQRLGKIVKLIRNLQEEVKTYHETLSTQIEHKTI